MTRQERQRQRAGRRATAVALVKGYESLRAFCFKRELTVAQAEEELVKWMMSRVRNVEVNYRSRLLARKARS